MTELPLTATLSFARSGPPYSPDNPLARPISFEDVADRLSHMLRFGATPGAISVLQHQVLGAEAIVNEGGSNTLAVLFLHHNDHEFVLGHETKPNTEANERQMPGYRAMRAVRKSNWDAAIYAALNLMPPDAWQADVAEAIRLMDQRMEAAESRVLFGNRAQAEYDRHERKTPTFSLRDDKDRRHGVLGHVWPAGRAMERWFDLHNRLTSRRMVR